ncbi:MAG: hypothetical protein KC561_04315, partial [Myxococcales bacterium]|nr:hypothetical protein [Myxococcales bacterium]
MIEKTQICVRGVTLILLLSSLCFIGCDENESQLPGGNQQDTSYSDFRSSDMGNGADILGEIAEVSEEYTRYLVTTTPQAEQELGDALTGLGLSGQARRAVMDSLAEAELEGDCGSTETVLDAGLVVQFRCLSRFRISRTGVVVVSVQPSAGEDPLLVAPVVLVSGLDTPRLTTNVTWGSNSPFAETLSEMGLAEVAHTLDALAEINGCNQSISGSLDDAFYVLACREMDPVSEVAVRAIEATIGPEFRAHEFLVIETPDGSSSILTYQVGGEPAHAMASNQSELEDAIDTLWGEREDTKMEFVSSLFLSTGECASSYEWRPGEEALRSVTVREGNRVGDLSTCSVRTVEPGSRADRDDRRVLTLVRHARSGGALVMNEEGLESASLSELVANSVPQQEAEDWAELAVELLTEGSCADHESDSEELSVSCESGDSGLAEGNRVRSVQLAEPLFEPAVLLGAPPTLLQIVELSPSWTDVNSAGERVFALLTNPTVNTDVLARGSHADATRTRLLNWGLSPDSVERALVRLNTSLATAIASYPLVLEEQNQVIFFNRGRLANANSAQEDIQILHGLSDSRTELEVMIFPETNGVTSSYEYRAPDRVRIETSLTAVMEGFGAPQELAVDIAEEVSRLISGAECGGHVDFEHPDVAGTTTVSCQPYSFDSPRLSLSAAGRVQVTFSEEPTPESASSDQYNGGVNGYLMVEVRFVRPFSPVPLSHPNIVEVTPFFDGPRIALHRPPIVAYARPLDKPSLDAQLIDRGLSEAEARLVSNSLSQIASGTSCDEFDEVEP